MEECIYYLKFGGETLKFNEQELDAFIYNNASYFEQYASNLIAIREAKTEREKLVDIITDFHKNSVTAASRSTSSTSVMHVTDLWGSVNPLNLKSQKDSKEDWKQHYIEENKNKGNNVTAEDAETAYKVYEETEGFKKTSAGTEFHEFLKEYVPSKAEGSEEKGTLSYESGKKAADDFITYLDNKFGKGRYTALAEQSMQIDGSKLDPAIKKGLIALIAVKNNIEVEKAEELFKFLVGTADLIIITDSGEVHIYDYKTSSKRFPDNWYSDNGTKEILGRGSRNKYEAQTWTYDAMLEAVKGIKNIHTHIVGFHTDANHQVDKFMRVVDLPANSQIKSNVFRMFSIYPKYTGKNLDETHKVTKAMFGDQTYITKEAEAYTASVEDYLDPKRKFFREEKEGSKLKAKGYNYSFYNFLTGERVGVKDKYTDGRKAVEDYVKEINARNATKLLDLGKSLSSCKLQDFHDMVKGAFGRNNDTFCNEISKYIESGWKLIDDDILFANGIFIFSNGPRYEIVMIDSSANSLFYEPKMRRGTSILGNFVSDDAVNADSRFYMRGNIGNMLIMKAAAFVATNSEIFKGAKISRIIALNPGRAEAITTCGNGWILNNFRALTRYAGFAENSNRIQDLSGILMGDIEAAMAVTEDYLQDLNRNDIRYNNLLRTTQSAKDRYTIEALRGLLNRLQDQDLDQKDVNVKRAIAELYKAILWVEGNYALVTEKDIKKFGSILTFSGGFMAPAALSPSANLRIINDINVSFSNAIAKKVQEYVRPWQNYYSELKLADWTGGEWNFFKKWFETDNSGKITTDFRIKDRDDSYWRTRQNEWEMAQYMLDKFWEFKTDHAPTDEDRNSDSYYEVPLCEATNLEVVETSGGIEGIMKVLNKEWSHFINLEEETINGQRMKIRMKDIDIDIPIIKNGYFEDAKIRKEKLEDPKKGPSYYEKNLDLVFLYVAAAAAKQECSKYFMPFFTGMRALMLIENEFGRAGMTDIAKTIDAYVKTAVFYGSLVPDEMRLLARVLGKIKGLISKGLLALSSVAITRELLSNHIKLFSTKIAEMKGKKELDEATGRYITLFDNFKLKDFEDAYIDMMKGAVQGFRSDSFDYQLNTRFRVANMSYREIPHRLKMNKYGLRNLDSNTLYLNVMAPDYIIRNAMLKAVLKTMGAYEAYSLNEKNDLVYDMSKDKRFNLLFKYKQGEKIAKSDYDHVPGKDRNAYKEQEALYLKSMDSWTIQGEHLAYGDFLPDAIDPEEQISIASQSVKLFGNFDDEQKSLIQKTLLGGLFFQFKTYGLCNWYNYVMPMTHTNIIRYVDAVDAKGKKYWLVTATEEEVAQGMPYFYQVSDDEITEEQKSRGYIMKDTVGVPAEGKFKSMLDLLTAAATGDKEKLQKLWDNRRQRANLFIMLHDSLFFVLIAGLMRLLFGEEKLDTMKEQDFWTRWSYTVAMGVAQDGPFWEIAKSLWSDGEIPAFRTLQRWSTTALSVFSGSSTFTYGLLNSFGATRELTSFLT